LLSILEICYQSQANIDGLGINKGDFVVMEAMSEGRIPKLLETHENSLLAEGVQELTATNSRSGLIKETEQLGECRELIP
jgi:hypothetical protein